MKVKEALIKSDVQIAPSNFSSDCAKAAQESWRISSSFCAVLAENLQVSCTSKCMLWFIQRFLKYIGSVIDADLTYGKIYECLGQEYDCYRVIDESDEDYLYPTNEFEIIEEIYD